MASGLNRKSFLKFGIMAGSAALLASYPVFIERYIVQVDNYTNCSFGLKYSKNRFPMFISRGIGWAIYPVRFNCYPEIAVLVLTGKTSRRQEFS
jgi:hypothetical protein